MYVPRCTLSLAPRQHEKYENYDGAQSAPSLLGTEKGSESSPSLPKLEVGHTLAESPAAGFVSQFHLTPLISEYEHIHLQSGPNGITQDGRFWAKPLQRFSPKLSGLLLGSTGNAATPEKGLKRPYRQIPIAIYGALLFFVPAI